MSWYSISTGSTHSARRFVMASRAESAQPRWTRGRDSMSGASSSSCCSSNMVEKMGLMPLNIICMPTMTMPRIKVIYSARPSSRLTDWKVRA